MTTKETALVIPDAPAVDRNGEYVDITYEMHDGVALITFNRPASLNAFRAATLADMRLALERAQADVEVRVLVLTGSGRAFSSGQDLGELGELLGDREHALRDGARRIDEVQDLTRRLLAFDKPIVAAINGVAVGLGAELALACDLRVASTEASIGFVEATRGLFQTNGVMYLLPRLVGYGRAMHLLLTGELLSGTEAERVGLVGRVVEPGELLPESMKLAEEVARNAPISVRLVKEVLSRTYDVDLDEMMQLEVEGMLTCLGSEDLHVGIESFLNKRKPSYRGQ
jgi:enoyl-CoA hydratase/carnithine racemase